MFFHLLAKIFFFVRVFDYSFAIFEGWNLIGNPLVTPFDVNAIQINGDNWPVAAENGIYHLLLLSWIMTMQVMWEQSHYQRRLVFGSLL